jgi:hypothetical protein
VAHAYNGPDPTQVADTDTYELGTAQKANTDVTLTGVRVWSGLAPLDLSGRTATVWSNTGAVLGSVALPTTLSSGWVEFVLPTPVERTSGQGWVVSFGSGGNYGFLSHGLDADLVSDDTAVSTLGFANAPSGINGRFNVNPTEFPASGNASHGFYGVDVVYTVGIGGNTPPVVTDVQVVDLSGTVTAVVSASDAETLTGATVRYDWGDGSAVSVTTWPNASATHTYAVSGLYAVLVSVTDTDGASGYKAVPVLVSVGANASGFDVTRVLDALVSHAAQLGPFEHLATHEPKTAPTQGLTGAVWVSELDLVPRFSGLASSTVRCSFTVRVYDNMLREPQDAIDPDMVKVISALWTAYNGDFTLGGLVTEVDLLGEYGPGLSMRSGYIRQDGKLLRAMSITVPVIVTDAYTQAP